MATSTLILIPAFMVMSMRAMSGGIVLRAQLFG